ncbi:DUF6207 family protein [Streptomyces sp. NBC_01003]|uniref:DUF6207 family protein n=1 Tax=Streptomyces sp. NBC_01003 TaxID=2903714 RepID=UPI003866985B|nr:DUF6207 family protein [Streptomyces sp. NBC_01003]
MTTNDLHQHIPVHVSVTIVGADEATVRDFANALDRCHNVTGPGDPYRVPGHAGVHIHVYGHTDPVDYAG